MRHRLLVVDDEDSILFAVREYFTVQRYIVNCARDVPEAKALMKADPYPLIIVDLRLGGVGETQGLELIRCMRRRWPGTRFILLTAYGSPAIEAEARALGVDAVLAKPMRLPLLERTVAELLQAPAFPRDARTDPPAEPGDPRDRPSGRRPV